ncbi:MAG: hypothetical protein HOG95_08380 [Rhodospirillaceae bacterium]|nr:hypothetical protein [Rhodospirillaceae bacterium]
MTSGAIPLGAINPNINAVNAMILIKYPNFKDVSFCLSIYWLAIGREDELLSVINVGIA